MSIIVAHCTRVFEFVPCHWQLGIAFATPFKFATVGFFLISGFLLGERVDRCNPLDYFLRRFKRIFVPWSLWFGIICVVTVIGEFIFHGLRSPGAGELLRIAGFTAWSVLTTTSFWFIPNLLLSISILLACRRYIYSLKFGLVLFLANLVYTVNVYALWFPSRHTQALFGFIFYLWLGSFAAQHFERINNFVTRIPTTAFAVGALITGVAAYRESLLLATLQNPDPLNTLRFSNQVFSIAMVLLIFKFRRATWPGFIDVRRYTYGLYLSHGIVLLPLIHLLKHHSPVASSIYLGDAEAILLWVGLSVVTCGSCLMITMWLANRPSLGWTVGLASRDSPPQPALRVLDDVGVVHPPLASSNM